MARVILKEPSPRPMRGPLPRVQWGAILAGVAFALATHVALGLLGASLGYWAEARDSRLIGVASGLFALMVAFTSSFTGAVVAARIAAAADNRTAFLHGTLVWCIGLVAGALFLSGTLAASVMGVSYAWTGGVVEAGTDAAGVAPIDAAAREAALASLFGGLGALAGLMGAFAGSTVGRQALTEAPFAARSVGAGALSVAESERRDGSADSVWSDPAFNRRRSTVEDRRLRRH